MLMVTRGYFAALAMWAAGHFGVSDERLAPLFLLNAVAPWLFIPAIAATALAVGRGRRTLGAACFLTGVLATWLFVRTIRQRQPISNCCSTPSA